MMDDAIVAKFAALAVWVLDTHQENECCDIDGADIEERAIQCGLLIYEKRDQPCGEDGACWCASYFHQNEWPVDCLRLAPGVRETANELIQRNEQP